MNVLAGCHEARSAVEIREHPCPVCNAPVEFFLRDGVLAAEARCDICGYTFPGRLDPASNARLQESTP